MTSKLSYHRLGVVLLGLVAGAAKALGCGGVPEGTIYHGEFIQTCEDDGPCGLVLEARCVGMLCACPTPGDAICLGGPTGDQWVCRPRYECHDPEPAVATDGSGGTGGGGGGMGGAAGEGGGVPMSECGAPSDCPQPPDLRCGFATCEEGRCGVVFTPGPTESQKRGDCKTVYCDTAGNATEKEDLGDYYNDGEQCTLDVCAPEGPQNVPYPDGLTCPEAGFGVCHDGSCVECVFDSDCPVVTDLCVTQHCVAASCDQNQQCGGSCTPCVPLKGCATDGDCQEGVCEQGKCAIPTCQDGVKNDSEPGTDCGAQSCPNLCPDGEGCGLPEDCISGVCWGGECQAPTCKDGVQNGEETGPDCGAGCPLPCKL